MSETELLASIKKALEGMGVWVVRFGSAGKRSSRGMASGEPGVPDLWTPYGFLEVKTPEGVLSEDQKRWHAKAERQNVNVATVRSVGQALDAVKSWQKATLSKVNRASRI